MSSQLIQRVRRKLLDGIGDLNKPKSLTLIPTEWHDNIIVKKATMKNRLTQSN